jgi:hypothetical protein
MFDSVESVLLLVGVSLLFVNGKEEGNSDAALKGEFSLSRMWSGFFLVPFLSRVCVRGGCVWVTES